MALARIKTWISEILTAADLNAEFNNILNNAISLISPLTGALDCDGKEVILDADADTSITADTDDQIDFKLNGVDYYRMTTTGLTTLSSTSLTVANGVTVTAGDLTVTAGDLTMTAGAVNGARATVASAATTADIWAANGNQIDYTGTTTCTGFPAAPQAGAERILVCAAAAPFTAGANMLIDGVASGNTVTCAANDIMIVRAVTTTQFRLSRVRYDGLAQVPSMVLLQTVTASSSATVDLETGIGTTYDDYVIIADGVRPATDGEVLNCRLKQAGAYVTSASYYYHADVSSATAATYSGINGSGVGQIALSAALDNASSTSSLSFTMDLQNVNSAALDSGVTWRGRNRSDSAAVQRADGVGSLSGAGVIQGVRFFMGSGNIEVGTFRLYGIRKS